MGSSPCFEGCRSQVNFLPKGIPTFSKQKKAPPNNYGGKGKLRLRLDTFRRLGGVLHPWDSQSYIHERANIEGMGQGNVQEEQEGETQN